MAEIRNFKVDQSTDFSFTVIYRGPDGNPIDLSQYFVYLQVKSAPGSKKILAACSIGDGITVDPEIGKIVVLVNREKTANLAYPKSAYDLVIQNRANGQVTRLVEGWFEVSRAVTIVD